MSEHTITLAFNIGDRVLIHEIESPATVCGINISHEGIQYQAKWFSNSDRKEAWLYAYELKALSP